MKNKMTYLLILAITVLFYSSCYNEQHFDMPGPYGDKEIIPDTLPFPFDSTRQAGMYLMKNGVPDYSKCIFKGFTDFVPRLGDTLSWYKEPGRYTSRQCYNFYPLNGNVDGPEFFGGVFTSYQYAQFWTKPFVKYFPGSKWYLYAKMSMPYINGCAPFFWFGGKGGFNKRATAGFDGANGYNGNSAFFMQVESQLINDPKWPTTVEVITPGEPFEMELICVDYFVYFKINGKTIWYYNLPKDVYSMPILFCPWRNSASFYDIYMEGDIEEKYDFVCNEMEKDYVTIQSPALTKAQNNEILLFAEGRVATYEMTNNVDWAQRRTNATDIVMKSSSDNGASWSELKTIAGDKNTVNMNPNAVTDKDGKTYVLYTVDHSGHLDGSTYDIYQITSTNHGGSWSAPQRVTTDLQGEYAQSTVSGHGLQISKGAHAGRLVVPTLCQKSDRKTVAVMYSDNSGASWTSGAVVTGAKITGANVIELNDGRLMLILSHDENTSKSQIAYSSDGGATWSDPVFGTLSTGNNGARFPGATVRNGNGEIVHFTPQDRMSGFANDENRIKDNPPYGHNFGATVSKDDGNSWESFQDLFIKVQQTYDGYYFLCRRMDAVALDDGTTLCITEGGVKCPKEGLVRFYK